MNSQSVTKHEISKCLANQNPTYQIDLSKKESNEMLLTKADFFVDKTLSCPNIKLLNSQISLLDCVKIGVLLSTSAEHLRRKNAHFPDLQFNLLDAVGISPTLVLNRTAKTKDKGSWILLKVQTAEVAKIVGSRCWCLCICAQYIKGYQYAIIKSNTNFTQNQLCPYKNSREPRLLLSSKTKFGVWI